MNDHKKTTFLLGFGAIIVLALFYRIGVFDQHPTTQQDQYALINLDSGLPANSQNTAQFSQSRQTEGNLASPEQSQQHDQNEGQLWQTMLQAAAANPRSLPPRLTAEERAVLMDLPMACTSDLPGFGAAIPTEATPPNAQANQIQLAQYLESAQAESYFQQDSNDTNSGSYPLYDQGQTPDQVQLVPPANRLQEAALEYPGIATEQNSQAAIAYPGISDRLNQNQNQNDNQNQAVVAQPAHPAAAPNATQSNFTQSSYPQSGYTEPNFSQSSFSQPNPAQRQSNEPYPLPQLDQSTAAEIQQAGHAEPYNLEMLAEQHLQAQIQAASAIAQSQNAQLQNAQFSQGGHSVDSLHYNPHSVAAVNASAMIDLPEGVDPHAGVFSKTPYPSALECSTCHQQIFDEWASSSHAYASISPMFHRFEDTINKLTQGTIGYFCMRCHAPVATTMGLRRDQPIWDGPRVFREGVTCVACHRVKHAYTKSNGERRIEPGGLYDPVYGGRGDGSGVGIANKYKEYFKVRTDPNDKRPGQDMHATSIVFDELSKSDFCASCHQVAVQPGIKLEVVWDQYRASPAYREGTTCQDCHMGQTPGKASGYSFGPAAVVDNKVVNPERRHSNHVFYGPGYSIAHPGIFPHNKEADRWSINEWLEFDWRAGWGTDKFEDALADGHFVTHFPTTWQEVDDRYDARDIVEDNLKKLHYKKDLRRQVMENGSKIDGPFFGCDPTVGQPLRFNYVVSNISNGHNMPSGSLGAQPQLWLNVVLIGPDGNRVWESGDLDTWGDLRDIHSSDVVQRQVPLDAQLFNLQTKFLTTNVKGTDRETFLPINLDVDQLPFIRPANLPVTTLNHPPLIRMEGHSIPALGARKAKYVIPGNLMTVPGTYRLSVRLRSRAEPIYFMRFVAATPEMIRMMNEWIVDIHPYSVVFEVQ